MGSIGENVKSRIWILNFSIIVRVTRAMAVAFSQESTGTNAPVLMPRLWLVETRAH